MPADSYHPAAPDPEADLEIELGGDRVPFRHLIGISGAFSKLFAEVGKSYAGTGREPIRWAVEVKPGSVRLPLYAEPATDEVRASTIREIPTVIVEGIALLEERPERPEYFSDAALEHARAVANHISDDLPSISLRNGLAPICITKRLVANVEEVLGPVTEAFGTVEGYLEALNIHGADQQFNVYDALTGKAIPCKFGRYVALEEVLAAVGRRVGARGRIKLKRNGTRDSIEVHSLMVFDEPEHFPTVEEVAGILKGFEETDE